jgi:hypothetical protein
MCVLGQGGHVSKGWQARVGRCVAVVVVLTCFAACSSEPGSTNPSPTGPTSSQSAPSTPVSARFSAIDIVGRAIHVTWLGVSGAERYIIEAGSSSGANDLAALSVTAPATAASLTDVLPREGIYVRVKAANAAGVSESSPELLIDMPDIGDVIEALFFGTGRYNLDGRQRSPAARMTGWADGAPVSVRVPHAVSGEQFDAVIQAVNDFNAAGLNLHIERATLTLNEFNQLRPPGVTFLIGEGLCARTPGAPPDVDCAVRTPFPIYATSSIRMSNVSQPARVWAHELGHAVGLEHVWMEVRVTEPSQVNLFAPHVPTMGGMGVSTNNGGLYGPNRNLNRFSELELEAVRRVYAAGLRPGSTLADFVARGLIRP